MPIIDFPTIGDLVQSPHDYVLDENGDNKYSLIDEDGSEIDEATRPILYSKLVNPVSYIDVSGFITTPFGLTIDDDDNFWVIDKSDQTLHKINSTLTGSTSFALTNVSGNAQGVTWDSANQYLWVIDFTNSVATAYDISGNVTDSITFNTSANYYEIQLIGDYFYLYSVFYSRIEKYDTSGILQDTYALAYTDSSAYAFDGTYWWVFTNDANTENYSVYLYDSDFVYQGIRYNTAAIHSGISTHATTTGAIYKDGIVYFVNSTDQIIGTFEVDGTSLTEVDGLVPTPTLTNQTALDSRVPYKRVADLQE